MLTLALSVLLKILKSLFRPKVFSSEARALGRSRTSLVKKLELNTETFEYVCQSLVFVQSLKSIVNLE